MPTKAQLSGEKARVIVLDIEDGDINLAKKAKVGAVISNKIETILADTGVEIIDRKLASKLQKEINLAEIKGNHDYKGPQLADFGITGKITSTTYSQQYIAASSWTDSKKKVHKTPARCKYFIKLEGTLNVHALPSLNMIDTIVIKDSNSLSQELTGSALYQFTRKKSCPGLDMAQINGLTSATGLSALNSSKIDLQNNFSPRGYVSEYRAKEDKHIIRISIGQTSGIKENQGVEIIQTFKYEDQLTGKTNTEERKLSDGSVSNQIGKKHAWIIVDEPEKASQIRLGDTVKVRYANGFFNW